MRQRLLCALVALGLATGPGCGTIVNALDFPGLVRIDGPEIYGGVRIDAFVITAGGGWTVLSLIDFPLSAVADTLLLPYTIPKAISLLPEEEPTPQPERR